MITQQEFNTMKTIVRCLIETVFANEDAFKDKFMSSCRWGKDEYRLERVHISGSRMRVSIKFEDNSDYDLYVDIDDVYSWYRVLMEKTL